MAKKKKTEQCDTCEFFKSKGNVGACRRFPPNQNGIRSEIDEQPTVHLTGWCGEYK